jgi:hypothetical protein
MNSPKEERSFRALSQEARGELHFVEALFGPPVYQEGVLTFTVKNFCITEDNPLNKTGQPLWIKDGTIQCLGVVSSERLLVPHMQKGDKLDFGEPQRVADVAPSSFESTSNLPEIITFELEGRMESPRAGVLSWIIKCASVNLLIND